MLTHTHTAVLSRLNRRLRQLKLLAAVFATVSCVGCITVPPPGGGGTHAGSHHGCASCAVPGGCANCSVHQYPQMTQAVPQEQWVAQPPAASVVPQPGPPACQPVPIPVPPVPDTQSEAYRECEERVAAMQEKLDAIQESQADRDQMNALTLQHLHRELQRLSSDVEFWKSEVSRLDRSATAQHEQDLQSLDSLIDLLEQIPASSHQVPPTTDTTSPFTN